MKCHHPDIFCAPLLNAQPMGFYAPAQIVRDAREHGVEVRRSASTKAAGTARFGLRMVKGLSNLHAAQILAARAERPFDSVEDVWRRSGVPLAALEKLADADAFRPRPRPAPGAVAVRGLGHSPLPLFAAADAREREPEVRSRR
jgi:error-prone DNA polymerase